MARQRNAGVFGPYVHGRKFRVVCRRDDGEVGYRCFATEAEAHRYIAAAKKEIHVGERTVSEAFEDYKKYLEEKGNKANSVATTNAHLRGFFAPVIESALTTVSPAKAEHLYEALRTKNRPSGKPYAVDTHRNMLAQARTFLNWCVSKKWMRSNPLEDVDGIGRRKHGKAQLRVTEARKWTAKAYELAEAGEPGAIAALCALLLGVRASEIVSRVVRDLDDDGRLLWIPDSKTEAGRRTLEVPERLRPLLLALATNKTPEVLLFGHHWRDWPRKWVQQICDLSGVPTVTAHGMRGLHSTIGISHGVSARVVAAALGHESSTTTLQSYAAPGAVSAARQQAVRAALEGGGTVG